MAKWKKPEYRDPFVFTSRSTLMERIRWYHNVFKTFGWKAPFALVFGAWVTPSTRPAGSLITSSIWNQDVVNNTQYLYDFMTTPYYYVSTNSQSAWGVDVYTDHNIGFGYKEESDGSASWELSGPTAVRSPVSGLHFLAASIRAQWNVEIHARIKFDNTPIISGGESSHYQGTTAPSFTIAGVRYITNTHDIKLDIKPYATAPSPGNTAARFFVAAIK